MYKGVYVVDENGGEPRYCGSIQFAIFLNSVIWFVFGCVVATVFVEMF